MPVFVYAETTWKAENLGKTYEFFMTNLYEQNQRLTIQVGRLDADSEGRELLAIFGESYKVR